MGKDIHGFEVRLASPCRTSWGSMAGGERVRFCGMCQKDVYELSGLTRAQITELLREKPGACVSFFVREDGTVLTADCPLGERLARRARTFARAKAAAMAMLMFAIVGELVALAKLGAESRDLGRSCETRFERLRRLAEVRTDEAARYPRQLGGKADFTSRSNRN